jgi:hypothetical protein
MTAFWDMTPCNLAEVDNFFHSQSALMMEAVYMSETSVNFYEIIMLYIPQGSRFHKLPSKKIVCNASEGPENHEAGEPRSKKTKSVAPEPAGSSPYLQDAGTGPYPEPTVSNLHPQQRICPFPFVNNKKSSPATRHGGAWGGGGIAPTHFRPRH